MCWVHFHEFLIYMVNTFSWISSIFCNHKYGASEMYLPTINYRRVRKYWFLFLKNIVRNLSKLNSSLWNGILLEFQLPCIFLLRKSKNIATVHIQFILKLQSLYSYKISVFLSVFNNKECILLNMRLRKKEI